MHHFIYHLERFFNSTFFQSFAIIISVFLGGLLAIKQFYSQQRTNRLQKIYFEDSLLKQLENLEASYSLSHQNFNSAIICVDLVSNFIDQTLVDKETLITSLEKIIDEMKAPIASTNSSQEVIMELFGDRGMRLVEWIGKADQDFKTFHALVTGQMGLLINRLKIGEAREKQADQKMLEKVMKNIRDNLNLIGRTQILLRLFSRLIRELSLMDFKDKGELLLAAEKPAISTILDKLDECFKIQYGFYKIDKNIFYSYAKDETGNNYKLTFDQKSEPVITKEKPIVKLEGYPHLIQFDSVLADATINNGYPFLMALIGLANLLEYGKKPKVIPVLSKFK